MRRRDLLVVGGLATLAAGAAFAITSSRVHTRDAALFDATLRESIDVLQHDFELLEQTTASLADYLRMEASASAFEGLAHQAQQNLPGTGWAWLDNADWGTNVSAVATSDLVGHDLMTEIIGDPAVTHLLQAVWSGAPPDPPAPTIWTADGAALATAVAVHENKAVLGVVVTDQLVVYPFYELGDTLDFSLADPSGERITATTNRDDPPHATLNVSLAGAPFTVEAWRSAIYEPPLPAWLPWVSATLAGLLVLFGGVALLGVRHRMRVRFTTTMEVELRTAELRAEAEARRRLVAFAAHDLRSPLAVVQGAVQYLRGDTDPDRAALLDSAERQTRRVLQLVNDLIDAAATEDGELQLEVTDIDAAALCRTVIADFGIPRTRVVGEATMRGDRARLERLLTNLLVNAAKYGPGNEPIVITCRRRGAVAEIDVCDGGTSLAGTDPERLFATFRRGDGESIKDVTGSGLGLAFAREVARAHGGDLFLACDAPTTFRLCVPAGAQPPPLPPPPPYAAVPGAVDLRRD